MRTSQQPKRHCIGLAGPGRKGDSIWRYALAFVYVFFPLFVAGCSSSGGSSTPTSPSTASLTGTWVGRASGIEIADFTMALVQSGTSVTGTGDVFFPGDGNRFAFDVTGSNDGSTVSLSIQLRQPRQGPAISYAGPVNGSMILGRLNGGNIQHDGPFTNTPLTLSSQNTTTPSTVLSVTLRNNHTVEIQILAPNETYSDGNRIAPGGSRVASVLDPQVGGNVMFRVGRNNQDIASQSCPMTRDTRNPEVQWNGSLLVCINW